MASVFLGPSGDEEKLPTLEALGTIPTWTVQTKIQSTKSKMSDGSYQWDFFDHKKVFQVSFGYLTNTELSIFKTLNALNQILRFKNEFEEDVWYDIVISDFSHDPERVDVRQLDRYRIKMTLEEI